MIVRPTSVEGFYYDSKGIEFTLAEWQAFSRAVEAGFALMREEV